MSLSSFPHLVHFLTLLPASVQVAFLATVQFPKVCMQTGLSEGSVSEGETGTVDGSGVYVGMEGTEGMETGKSVVSVVSASVSEAIGSETVSDRPVCTLSDGEGEFCGNADVSVVRFIPKNRTKRRAPIIAKSATITQILAFFMIKFSSKS